MSVSKNFENIPRVVRGACRPAPPTSDRGSLSPPIGRLGGPTQGRHGGLSPPLGRPALTPLYKSLTPIPSSFEPKNSTKNPEKRGVRRREAAKPCRIAHL